MIKMTLICFVDVILFCSAWNDTRAALIVDRIAAQMSQRSQDAARLASGLPMSPYFSALKMRWLLENVRSVRRAAREGKAIFGTVDSWLIWVIFLMIFSIYNIV